MGYIWILVITINLLSMLFLGVSIFRVLDYAKRYPIAEFNRSLLFGSININVVSFIYIIVQTLFTASSIAFVFIFIS